MIMSSLMILLYPFYYTLMHYLYNLGISLTTPYVCHTMTSRPIADLKVSCGISNNPQGGSKAPVLLTPITHTPVSEVFMRKAQKAQRKPRLGNGRKPRQPLLIPVTKAQTATFNPHPTTLEGFCRSS